MKHCALFSFAHTGQLAALVQSLTLTQATLPQAALNALGGGALAHCVKQSRKGMVSKSAASLGLEIGDLGGFMLFVT